MEKKRPRLRLSDETIEQIKSVSSGLTFQQIYKKFYWISKSKLYIVLNDYNIPYQKNDSQARKRKGDTSRQKERKERTPGIFSFDDFKDQSGYLKVI